MMMMVCPSGLHTSKSFGGFFFWFLFFLFQPSMQAKYSQQVRSNVVCLLSVPGKASTPEDEPPKVRVQRTISQIMYRHQQRATQRGHSHAPRRFVVCCTLLAQMRRDPATCASLIKLPNNFWSFYFVIQITLQFSQRSHTRNKWGLAKCDNLCSPLRLRL